MRRPSFCVEPMTPALWFHPGSMPMGTSCTSPVRVFTHSRVRPDPGSGPSETSYPLALSWRPESWITVHRHRHPFGG